MKMKLAAIILLLGSAIGAAAQLTTVTASNLSRGGQLIPAGTICFTATGIPGAGFQIGSTGQSSGQPVCRDVTNGAIMPTLKGVSVGSLQVADTSLSSPTNVCYNVTVRDPGGIYLLGTAGGQYSGYSCVQPSGASFNFDAYVPAIPNIALGQSINDLSVNNLTVQNCSGPGCSSGNGGGAMLKTNGTNNSSQTVFNFQNGSGTTVSNPSGGNVQVAVIYGSTSNTAAQGNDGRITGAEQTSHKGAANGYAPLDGNSLLPHGNLPALLGADIPNNAASTTGNAATATGAQAAGSECASGFAPRGVDASWNAKDCQSLAASGMLNPMTSPGDTIYGGASGAPQRLPGNTAATDQVYVSRGNGSSAQAPTLQNAPALSAANMANFPAFPESQITNLISDLAGKQASLGYTAENAANKGVASGYAPLDGSSKLPHSNLPTLIGADVPNNAANTSGNAATATAFAGTPTKCSTGSAPTGIDASGNAQGCTSLSAGGGDTTAKYVIGAPDATLTNSVVNPGLYGSADNAPPSAGSLDDEFAGSSLNTSSRWTWVNQGSTTATVQNSFLVLSTPNGGGGNNIAYIYQTAPPTPWAVAADIALDGPATSSFAQGGIVLADSSGKLIHLSLSTSGGVTALIVNYMDSVTSYDAEPLSVTVPEQHLVMKVQDDGTNLVFSISLRGQGFVQMYSVSRTAFLSAGPTRVGLLLNNASTNFPSVLESDWFRRVQ